MMLPLSNIGPRMSWMHKNPTEEHSRNVGGISKNIIGVLHSVCGIERCQGRKETVHRGHIFSCFARISPIGIQSIENGYELV